MKSKHTPAPWRVNTLENPIRTIHATRGHVATVSLGTMGEVGADEIEANARLIAAAPELLEACKLAAARFDRMFPRIAHVCRAAIAKAEGQI